MSGTVQTRLALGMICLVGLWLSPLFVPGILNPFTPSARLILYAQNLVGYSLIFLAPFGAALIVAWDGYRALREDRFGAWFGLVLASGVVAIVVHVILSLVTTPLAFVPAVNEFFFTQTGGGDVAGLRGIGVLIGWPFLAMTILIPVTAILILVASGPLLSRRSEEAGADAYEIASCALLVLALFGAMLQGFKSVNDDGGLMTPLGAAARGGNVVAVRELLRAGADPTRAGPYMGTPLQIAAGGDNEEIVTALLQAGARDTDGRALIGASQHANPAIVRDLLATQSPVNAQSPNQQRTPLMIAAGAIAPSGLVDEPGFPVDEVVSLLVKAGADVNARDSSGGTALDEANRLRRESVVKILIAAGANPH